MKSLLILVCGIFLSISVIAQSDSNTKTIKKANDAQPVEFTIKKVNSNTLINKRLTTIHPATKVANLKLEQHPAKAIDNEKLKLNSKAIKRD